MIYRFDGYALDDQLCELRRGGTLIAVEPKAFRLLHYLLARRERVVSREELLAGLWPNEQVTPSSLTFCVNGARRAVGDDGVRQAVIRNLRGQGYRFVAACEEQPPAAGPAPVRAAAPPFVGRGAEMAVLRAALDDLQRGAGGVVLLSGEPGIGKTRTAEEAAALARESGVRVLIGRCHEGDDSPAFWPWLQMIRGELTAWRPAQLAGLLGAGAADIARVLPAVRSVLPQLPEPPPLDFAQARVRLFDSLAGYFRALAEWQPLLLVLDDLHGADRASIAFLRALADELGALRVLIVGTYRDTEVDAGHPFAEVAASLRREGARLLRLDGLSAVEVGALLAHDRDRAVDAAESARVVRDTEGNPLFVLELARQLREGGAAERPPGQGLPDTVERVIERRLSRLGDEVREVLGLAAVCGREFDAELLEAVAPRALGNPRAPLAEARRLRVIEAVPGAPDRYRFAHILIRESLYASVPAAARRAAHGRLARLLGPRRERSHVDAADAAQHALAALPDLELAAAVEAALRAAERALAVLAYEDAVRYCERTLEAIDRHAPDDRRWRCRVLLMLGEARSRVGEAEASRVAFDEAAAIARRGGLRRELALAALRGSGGMVQPVILMQEQVEVLREALAKIGGRDPLLRSRLLSRLALALYYHRDGRRGRRRAMSDEAVRLARAAGDDEALYWALISRHWALWGPRAPRQRLAVAEQLVAIGERRGQRPLALRAHTYRVGALLELGELAAVDDAIATCAALADALRIPMFLWTVAYFRAMQAQLRGDLDEAQRRSGDAAARGSGEAGEVSAAHVFGIQVCAQAFLGGSLATFEPLLLAYRQQRPDMPFLECALVEIYRQAARTDEARALLRTLAAGGCRRIPHDNLWMTGVALLGVAAAGLDDRPTAATIHRILEPYAGQLVVCGNAVATIGPVDHYLALLAGSLGRRREAGRHLRAAERIAARIGSPAWLVERNAALAVAGRRRTSRRTR